MSIYRKNCVVVLHVILLVLSPVLSGGKRENYGSIEVAEIVKVIDGDTFRCNLHGYPPLVGKNISVRLAGIDTPELRDRRPEVKRRARAAKAFLAKRLLSARTIELRNIRRGKYFRIIADVYTDGINLNLELLRNKYARKYSSRK